jgi:hypothetical protein
MHGLDYHILFAMPSAIFVLVRKILAWNTIDLDRVGTVRPNLTFNSNRWLAKRAPRQPLSLSLLPGRCTRRSDRNAVPVEPNARERKNGRETRRTRKQKAHGRHACCSLQLAGRFWRCHGMHFVLHLYMHMHWCMHPSDLRLLFSLGLGQSNGPAGGRTGAESGVHRRHSLYVRVCSAAPRATRRRATVPVPVPPPRVWASANFALHCHAREPPTCGVVWSRRKARGDDWRIKSVEPLTSITHSVGTAAPPALLFTKLGLLALHCTGSIVLYSSLGQSWAPFFCVILFFLPIPYHRWIRVVLRPPPGRRVGHPVRNAHRTTPKRIVVRAVRNPEQKKYSFRFVLVIVR